MSFTRSGVPFFVTMTVSGDVLRAVYQPDRPDIYLLRPLLYETSSRIRVVVRELLLDLRQAQSVSHELVWVNTNLIFACRAAKTRNIDHVRDGLEILFNDPVFKGFQFHRVIGWIRAVQGKEIDLANRTPVRPHLRVHTGRQSDLAQSFKNPLPVPGIVRLVVENELEIGQAA